MVQQAGRFLLSHLARQAWAGQQQQAAGSLAALKPYVQTVTYASKPTALIKELREKSGAPISDVKKSLEEADWDLDKAYEVLRKRGLAAAAKKASRHAADGLVGVAVGPGAAAIVEVNSETDFVARNELFTGLVQQAAEAALSLGPSAAGADYSLDADALASARTASGPSVSDACAEVAAKMRENIKLRRGFLMSTAGVMSPYVHTAAGPNMGRIIGMVAVESASGPIDEAIKPQVAELSHNLAMHAVGMRAQYLSRDAVPASVLEHERGVLTEQAATSGKPAAVVQKMVEGRLGKFYEEVCLLEQKYLLDDSQKVAAAVKAAGAKLGVQLKVAGMLRVQVGEGLQSAAAKDFAAEVAEMAGSG